MGRKKLTNEYYKIKFENKILGRYELISDFISMQTKAELKCLKCNNIRRVSPIKLSDHDCPYCTGKNWSHDRFIYELNKIHGDKFNTLNKYRNSHYKIRIQCNECKFEWSVMPHHIINSKSGCPACASKKRGYSQRLTNEEFLTKMKRWHADDILVIDKYTTAKNKIQFKCNKCGHIWISLPNGHGCPSCTKSYAENLIHRILIEKGIKFDTEVRFDDCRNKNPLPFDFVIYGKSNDIATIIEFDGIQHFQPIEWFGGEEGLKQQRIHDDIKTNYCLLKNIKLVRIRYNQISDISKILQENLDISD